MVAPALAVTAPPSVASGGVWLKEVVLHWNKERRLTDPRHRRSGSAFLVVFPAARGFSADKWGHFPRPAVTEEVLPDLTGLSAQMV